MGLCGNFDLKTVNEMRTPENLELTNPQEFGSSWAAVEVRTSSWPVPLTLLDGPYGSWVQVRGEQYRCAAILVCSPSWECPLPLTGIRSLKFCPCPPCPWPNVTGKMFGKDGVPMLGKGAPSCGRQGLWNLAGWSTFSTITTFGTS